MKSFVVRSIVTVLLAMLVISAFPMWVFAERAEQGIQPSEETIRCLATEYLNERNRMLVSSRPETNVDLMNAPTIQPSEMMPQVATRQKGDIGKIQAFTKKMESKGLKYWNRFETMVEIEELAMSQEQAVARISEYTRLYFAPSRLAPPGEYSSFGAERYFTFVRSGNTWTISDVKLVDPGVEPPPNEPSAAPRTLTSEEASKLRIQPATKEEIDKQKADALANDVKSQRNAMMSEATGAGRSTLNAQRVIDYCNTYTDNSGTNSPAHYNLEWYPYFPNADCTNFTSQCLDQAGWEYRGSINDRNINNWYSRKHWWGFQYTDTWNNAQNFYRHVKSTNRAYFTANYNCLRVGDVVQVDMQVYSGSGAVLDHSVIISLITSWHYTGKYYSSHTNNRHNWPLTYMLGMYNNSTHWWVLIKTY